MTHDPHLMAMLRVLGTMDVGDAVAHHMDLFMAWRAWCKNACPMPEPGPSRLLHPTVLKLLDAFALGPEHYTADMDAARRQWANARHPYYAETPAPTTDADALQVVIDAGLDARPDLAPAVGRALLAERETLARARARVTELESLLFGPDNESGLFYAAAAVSHGGREASPQVGRGGYVTEGEWNWLETCVRNVLGEGSSA